MTPTTRPTTAATFTGIPDEALEFYEGLEADNSKAYWTDHKHIYDTQVRGPIVALCEALCSERDDFHVFRPYRDLRFAKDKRPYKTHQGATVGKHYLQIGASGLFVATGYYRMAADQIAAFRSAVDDDMTGAELEELVSDLREFGYVVDGDTLKTRPRGYPPDHPRIDLLRHRSLVAWADLGAPDWLSTPAAVDHVVAAWRDIEPLRDWLDRNVGPSTEPRR